MYKADKFEFALDFGGKAPVALIDWGGLKGVCSELIIPAHEWGCGVHMDEEETENNADGSPPGQPLLLAVCLGPACSSPLAARQRSRSSRDAEIGPKAPSQQDSTLLADAAC